MTDAERIAQAIYSTHNRKRTTGRHGDMSMPEITPEIVKRTARNPTINTAPENVTAELVDEVNQIYTAKPGTPPALS